MNLIALIEKDYSGITKYSNLFNFKQVRLLKLNHMRIVISSLLKSNVMRKAVLVIEGQ